MSNFLVSWFSTLGIFGLVLFSSCTSEQGAKEDEDDLSEKIAQMIMIGFRDTLIDAENHIYRDIATHKIGGVILFEYDMIAKQRPRNISSQNQLNQLTNQLQTIDSSTLFIAIDEEGGRVSRLNERYGFSPTLSPEQIDEVNNPDSTLLWANGIANKLADFGINVNFAPVVDLNVDPNSPAIGALGRSFSSDVDILVDQAEIFIAAHEEAGIIATLKHFPGHGSAQKDSHIGFVDVTDTWSRKELDPYAQLIEEGFAGMIMTAHVFNENLDPNYPATLSSATLNLLRQELGWEGVIVSDDLNMGAIADNYSFEEVLEKTINSGMDMLLYSNNIGSYDADIVPKIIDGVKQLIQAGRIKRETIDAAYQRIMTLKEELD